MLIGVVAAALASLGYGAATVLQAGAVTSHHLDKARRRWLFVAGLALDGVAWLLSLVAFGHLPLATAEAVLASSVAVTAILADAAARRRIARRTWVAGSMFALGATLIAGATGPVRPHAVTPLLLVISAATLAVVIVVAAGVYRRGSAPLLSAVAGVAFTGTAVCGRLLDPTDLSVAAVLDVVLLVGFSGAGVVTFARALARGTEAGTAAVMWTTELIVALVAGVALLGDAIRPASTVPAAAGIGGVVAACWILTRTNETRTRVSPTEQFAPSGHRR
ncbi:hypothetical protein [Aeromicrobium sp.]|uniref:hypothetical protein n=1 Tax=Aeromicrobium sp. TaxID=1871063 RepID=UPI00199B5CE6|nr:hypothetical protein [Aeromicrobium sp.]MBC7631704.1 hypothetical protein [Aeromicrobium sp.]